jgi:DNA-binding PadR family transcriptional regulator
MEKVTRYRSTGKNLVLMRRDIAALVELYLHRTVGSSQLARLCFPEISYETARKRLRRLQQAGFTAAASSGRMEGRGRPELIYFLTSLGAKALEQNHGVSWETVPTGPPHTYHKEHFLRLVDIRLAMQEAQKRRLIEDLQFITGREFWRELYGEVNQADEQADATITFCFPGCRTVSVLLEIDTGNFRQTRHWEPKIRSFLRTGHPVWVITGNAQRISTLQKWTEPLLKEAAVETNRCLFGVYDDIVENGIFGATWRNSDGDVLPMRFLGRLD